MKTHTNWTFRRPSMIPIVEVKGESQSLLVENIMIQQAVEFIEKAKKFDGRVLTDEPKETTNIQGVVVRFSIIFPSESSINGFLSILNNR